MAPAFDLERLPTALRILVARALEDVDACEEAIELLEAIAATRQGRSPEVLLALALVTYKEAAELVLIELEPASERAIALIDEATAAGAPVTEGLRRFRLLCQDSLERELRRSRRRRPARDAMERARRAWMRGEDALAAELARMAAALDGLESAPARAVS